jgi:hypothetical protein
MLPLDLEISTIVALALTKPKGFLDIHLGSFLKKV